MARAFKGRPLTGDQIRQLNNDLRDQGLKRELTKAVGRGDSPTQLNRLFKQAGYNLNRWQTIGVISHTYRPQTSLRYFDKLKARYGSRSAINAENLAKAGWNNEVLIRAKISYSDGQSFEISIEYDGANYSNLTQLLDDAAGDLNKKYVNNRDEIGTVQILDIGFR